MTNQKEPIPVFQELEFRRPVLDAGGLEDSLERFFDAFDHIFTVSTDEDVSLLLNNHLVNRLRFQLHQVLHVFLLASQFGPPRDRGQLSKGSVHKGKKEYKVTVVSTLGRHPK
jgi:hypothetical protein